MSTDDLPDISDRFLSKPEVLRIAGFSAATLWREVNAGRFPTPVSISAQRKGFLESEIRSWIANRIASRRNAAQEDRDIKATREYA